MTERKEKIYIEIVRLVAILLVLYCHTSVNGLLYFQQGKGNRSSQLAIFIYPVAAGCVQLFFYDLRHVAVTKKGEHRNSISEQIFQISFGDTGGCAGILSVGWRESVGQGIF